MVKEKRKHIKRKVKNRTHAKNLGIKGEKIAAKHLTSKGYRIIARNFRNKYCEIDLVAKDRETLVFVEVKTRQSSLYGPSEEAVDSRKIKKLIKGANLYKLKNPGSEDQIRIDFVAVSMRKDGEVESVKHYKNITI